MKNETLKSKRENAMYTTSLILHGNNKLKDYDDTENGVMYRYAQFNTRALLDCPFKSKGCTAVCYATKGNHQFPDVKASREKAYNVSLRDDFPMMIDYTIRTEKQSGRYKNAVMLIRIHESGDFYSLKYLKKWVRIWDSTADVDGLQFVFYTKSFQFFIRLSSEEKDVIWEQMKRGRLSINLSIDDTTTPEQMTAYLDMMATFPKANTYRCTENTATTEHDNVCDCADCAKCGICNTPTGKKTVVKIHSASKADMEVYRENSK